VSEPSGRDADFYLRLLEITQQRAQSESRRWFFGEYAANSYEDFQSRYPEGGDERALFANVLNFFEAVGALVSRGLLNEDLYFDAPLGLEVVWPKVEPVLEGMQKALGDPAAYENVAWLGRRYSSWREQEWKPKSETKPPDKAPEKAEPHVRGFQHD